MLCNPSNQLNLIIGEEGARVATASSGWNSLLHAGKAVEKNVEADEVEGHERERLGGRRVVQRKVGLVVSFLTG